MRNRDKVNIPASRLRKVFPSLPEDTQVMECVENVCKLPAGQREVPLDIKFIIEVDGKSYTIYTAVVMGCIMYFPEEII